jgi:hypothetical protein
MAVMNQHHSPATCEDLNLGRTLRFRLLSTRSSNLKRRDFYMMGRKEKGERVRGTDHPWCDGIPHHLGNRAACDAANAYGQTSLITCFSKHFWDGYRGVIGCCSSSSSSSFSPCLDVFTTIAVMDRALTHLHCLRASSVTTT